MLEIAKVFGSGEPDLRAELHPLLLLYSPYNHVFFRSENLAVEFCNRKPFPPPQSSHFESGGIVVNKSKDVSCERPSQPRIWNERAADRFLTVLRMQKAYVYLPRACERSVDFDRLEKKIFHISFLDANFPYPGFLIRYMFVEESLAARTLSIPSSAYTEFLWERFPPCWSTSSYMHMNWRWPCNDCQKKEGLHACRLLRFP